MGTIPAASTSTLRARDSPSAVNEPTTSRCFAWTAGPGASISPAPTPESAILRASSSSIWQRCLRHRDKPARHAFRPRERATRCAWCQDRPREGGAMTQLLDLVLEAHGGIARWRTFDTVRATFLSGGGLLPMKGLETLA